MKAAWSRGESQRWQETALSALISTVRPSVTASSATAMLGLQQSDMLIYKLSHPCRADQKGVLANQKRSIILLLTYHDMVTLYMPTAYAMPLWSILASPRASQGVQGAAPAGRWLPHNGQLHGLRPVQQRVVGWRRGRPALWVPPPEELGRRLPKEADLILHSLKDHTTCWFCQSHCAVIPPSLPQPPEPPENAQGSQALTPDRCKSSLSVSHMGLPRPMTPDPSLSLVCLTQEHTVCLAQACGGVIQTRAPCCCHWP